MNNAIKIKNLCKIYKNNTVALKNLNIQIKKGDFFALLGSNGAGKTTAINIISGLLAKSSGYIKVFGIDKDKKPNEVKKLIGLMPQEFNFNPFEPIIEILVNQAGYYGIPRKKAQVRAEELLDKMQLLDKKKSIAKYLSGGMKRRLMLARSLMHQPKILILDEPSAGVDIEIRNSIWQYLKELNNSGITIVLTTHYLEEAENLCRNIAIIDNGKVVTQSLMSDLLNKTQYECFILESLTNLPSKLNLAINYERINSRSIKIEIDKSNNISDIIIDLVKQNIVISRIDSPKGRLENLFLKLTNNK